MRKCPHCKVVFTPEMSAKYDSYSRCFCSNCHYLILNYFERVD